MALGGRLVEAGAGKLKKPESQSEMMLETHAKCGMLTRKDFFAMMLASSLCHSSRFFVLLWVRRPLMSSAIRKAKGSRWSGLTSLTCRTARSSLVDWPPVSYSNIFWTPNDVLGNDWQLKMCALLSFSCPHASHAEFSLSPVL